MSYELWVWAGPAYTADAVSAAVRSFVDSGLSDVFDPNAALVALRSSILETFPPLEGLSDEGLEHAAWAVTPERSDRLLGFSILLDEVDEVAPVLVKRAFDMGLFVFDPQDGTIYPPLHANPRMAVGRPVGRESA